MKFAILFDGTEYDVAPCPEGIDCKTAVAKKYPPSSGWVILDTAETMDEATFRVDEFRARAKADAR